MRWTAALALTLAVAGASVWHLPAARGDEPRRGRAVTVAHQPRGERPALGPRHAPVTIEFFVRFDGMRPEMKSYELVQQLRARHPRRVRVVFYVLERNRPLSHAALAAFALGKFHQFAYVTLGVNERATRTHLRRYAKAIGARRGALVRAAESSAYTADIIENEALYYQRTRGGRETRHLFINGAPVTNTPDSLDAFEEIYDAHFAKAKELLERGVAVEDVFAARVAAENAAWLERSRREAQFLPGEIEGEQTQPAALPPQLIRSKFDMTGFPSRGAPNAPVVVALMCNFQSRGCAFLHKSLALLLEHYAGELRVVFMPLLSDEAHPDARLAHEAALCAQDQGLFWEYADQVFKAHRPELLGAEALLDYARALGERRSAEGDGRGIDLDRFQACVSGRAHQAEVDAAVEHAQANGVLHVPSLVVGRRIYVGRRAERELRWLIERERSPGVMARARFLRVQILERVTAALDPLFPPPPETSTDSPLD